MKNRKRNIAVVVAVAATMFVARVGWSITSVNAADSDFSDGITVDSTLDTSDVNIGDTICDDGDGNCTLRAAIEEANSNPDATTIKFNISGTPDFTNNTQDGYTIKPQSALPDITTQVTIDGYTQPGAAANTTASPNPFDGTLLIELDGSQAGADVSGLVARADDSRITGLVINSFSFDAIGVAADNLTVQGCYLGTDATGLVDKGNNGMGIAVGAADSDNLLAGGLDPEDRNLISGNENGGLSPNDGADNWLVQGNYFGLDATGLAAIPNAVPNGSGALSLDNTSGTIVGGLQPGAINVISGNNSMGIAPHNAPNLTIEGNYIGTDYTGVGPLPNGSAGISISGISTNVVFKNNIIQNNLGDGVFVDQGGQVAILGNSIANNTYSGISLQGTPAQNDPLDTDTGANDLLNSPTYTNVQEASGDTTVDYVLDVPAGDYRIEYFSNTAPDPSGSGEGEQYLGFQNVTSSGTGEQTFSYTLTGVTGVQNLAMTTTQIDGSIDGFGATSAFGGLQNAVDLPIAKTLTDPENVSPGGTIHYALTVTQNGRSGLDLSQFDGSGLNPLASNVFLDYLPPELTYVSSSNPDVSCVDTGSSFITIVAAGHTDWHGIFCSYTGQGQVLHQGESITTTLEVTVANDSDLVFTNYAMSSVVASDRDAQLVSSYAVAGYMSGGEQDFIDAMIANPNNNFAAAEFPVPAQPEPAHPTNKSSSSSLSSTGQNISLITITAVCLVLGSFYIYRRARES